MNGRQLWRYAPIPAACGCALAGILWLSQRGAPAATRVSKNEPEPSIVVTAGAAPLTVPRSRGKPVVLAQAPTPEPVPQAPSAPRKASWFRDGGLSFDELTRQWDSEKADAEWTQNVDAYVHAMLEPEELTQDVIRDVDCRESLCRVRLNTKNMTPLWRIERTLRKQDRYPYERRIVQVDGEGVAEAMLARDGSEAQAFPKWAHVPDAGVR